MERDQVENLERGRGHWDSYYPSPQSLIITFLFVESTFLGTFIEFSLVGSFSWVSKLLKPLIIIYIRGNFWYYHLGCTSIYQTLSYPFRCLMKTILSWMSEGRIESWILWVRRKKMWNFQGGRGHCAIYCTNLQSFIIMFSYSMA